jgi:hypothetical protein
MNPTAKEVLDMRLANGEISEPEYRDLVRTLTDSEPASWTSVVPKLRSLVSAIDDRIFGFPPAVTPTNASPWTLTDNVVLYGDNLLHKGNRRNYSDISSINYWAVSSTVNFINIKRNNHLELVYGNGDKITMRAFGAIIESSKHRRIASAYNFLCHVTFKQRLQRYLDLLQNPGYFVAGGVRVDANGEVEKDGVRLSIPTAEERGALELGSHFGNPEYGHGATDPYTIVVGETRTGLFAKKIVFRVTENQDVVFDLIRYLVDRHN